MIEGEARVLPDLILEYWHGPVGTVICDIPLERCCAIGEIEATRAPARRLFHDLVIAGPPTAA